MKTLIQLLCIVGNRKQMCFEMLLKSIQANSAFYPFFLVNKGKYINK